MIFRFKFIHLGNSHMKFSEMALHVGCGDFCHLIETIVSLMRDLSFWVFVDSLNSSFFQVKTLVLKSIRFHYQLTWLWKRGSFWQWKIIYINMDFSIYGIIWIHVNLNPWDKDILNNHYWSPQNQWQRLTRAYCWKVSLFPLTDILL